MFKFNDKLIFSKIFRDLNSIFFLFLLSFGLIVWIIQAVNFLDFVTEDGHGLLVYFKFTFLNIPKILVKLSPIIFFFSLFYILEKYEETNELKIFWLLGITKKIFVKKIIKFSLLYSIVLLIFTVFVVPISQNKSRQYIQKSKIDFFPSLIQEKKFIDVVEGLTIFIEQKNNNDYKNLILIDGENINKKIIYAHSGQLLNNDANRTFVLKEGKVININNKNITEFNFNTTKYDLTKFATKSIVDFKIQEKKTKSLISCYWNFFILNKKELFFDEKNCNDNALNEIQSEIYNRTIKPFYILLLAVCCTYILNYPKESNNYKKKKIMIFVIGIFVTVLSEIFDTFLDVNPYSLIIYLIIPLILLICFYLNLVKEKMEI